MNFLKQFFQDNNGDSSISRLVMFGTFLIAAIVMLWLMYQGKMSEGYFTMFLGIPTIAYGHTKWQDNRLELAKNSLTIANGNQPNS